MRALYWVIGVVVGVPVLLALVMYGASELGGEVVTLDRAEADGGASRVRIWIVDQEGLAWIEHGDPDAYWISLLAEAPDVVLTREGRKVSYLGTPDPDSHDLYHQLRRQKYGWGDRLVGLFGGGTAACSGVPVRLQLVE